jgi:hypothetical protein
MAKLMNVTEILAALSAQIKALETDTTTSSKANATANVVGKIVAVLKLQLEYNKQMGRPRIIQVFEIEHVPEPEGEPQG